MHGCSGALDNDGKLSALYQEDVDRWGARGYNVLILDSFTGRQVKSICELSTNARGDLTTTTRSADVDAALAWLVLQPSVAPRKIVLVGRSHGAQTVLTYLGLLKTGNIARAENRPALSVAYYPGCSVPLRSPSYQISLPLLLMVGGLITGPHPNPAKSWRSEFKCSNQVLGSSFSCMRVAITALIPPSQSACGVMWR